MPCVRVFGDCQPPEAVARHLTCSHRFSHNWSRSDCILRLAVWPAVDVIFQDDTRGSNPPVPHIRASWIANIALLSFERGSIGAGCAPAYAATRAVRPRLSLPSAFDHRSARTFSSFIASEHYLHTRSLLCGTCRANKAYLLPALRLSSCSPARLF